MVPDLISAIMPVFNAAKTIGAAIRSIREQQDQAWELIVVDDGSTDDTLTLAREAAAADPRILVFAATRGGRGRARNICLQHVRGRLVAICDGDDICLPERFSQQRLYLDRNVDCDVVTCSRIVCFTEGGDGFVVVGPSDNSRIQATFRRGRMPLQFASAMIRASVFERFGRFDPELQRNQDFGYFVRIHSQLHFGTVPESLILYRSPGRIAPFALILENNFFRLYATMRARGETRSADDVRGTAFVRFYRLVIVPAQYARYVVARLLLSRPSAAESAALQAALDRDVRSSAAISNS